MSHVPLVLLITACISTAVPSASHAAQPAKMASLTSCPPPMSRLERRVAQVANDGMPALIHFVYRTRMIYHLTVEEAVAIVDAQRAREQECAAAPARG